MNIQSLTLRQLVKLHNEHVPEGRRVRTFQTKSTALKRVAAVLPKEPPARLRRALSASAPAKTRAPRTAIDSAKALATLRCGCEIAELAAALGGTERVACTCIDGLRRADHSITNTGRRTFKLG